MAENKQDLTKWAPSPLQANLLEAAQQSGLNRNISKICNEADVSRESFYKWMREDPGFAKAWDEIWVGTLKRHYPGAIQALCKKAEMGDINAIKLISELLGKYKQLFEHSGPDGGPIETKTNDNQFFKNLRSQCKDDMEYIDLLKKINAANEEKKEF